MRATAVSCGTTSGARAAARRSRNRGAGMWHDKIYMVTPDNYLVSLESKTGKERWRKEVRGLQPAVLLDGGADHRRRSLLIGTGNDLDSPGYLQSLRSGHGRDAVAAVHGADEDRRSRTRDVAEPRSRALRRRASLAAWRLRSRDEAVHLRHGQSRFRRIRPGAAKATTSSRARSLP